MIVIHIDNGSHDAAILSRIYEGLDGITLSYNQPKKDIRRLLYSTGKEPVMLLGHGTPRGLLNIKQDGFSVGPDCAHWLRGRDVIGIFCFAAEYADRYGLRGFFTSMYISNMTEAIMEQEDQGATDEIIAYQDGLFCDRVRKLLVDKTPLSEWPEILQSQADWSLPFVRFNYEAMCYFE